MSADILKHLFDIQTAIQDIIHFVKDLTFDIYSSDVQVKAATERKFEIIGEALNRIKHQSPDQIKKIRDHEKIIAFRNILANGYDRVSDSIVWDIIEINLPLLAEDVHDLIEQNR